MQNFPITPGNTAQEAVYAHVSPEQAPQAGLSDEQREAMAEVERMQQAARSDPYLNGQDAVRRLRS